jgi:hypothetical protein
MIFRRSPAYSSTSRRASSRREGFGSGTSLPETCSSGLFMSPMVRWEPKGAIELNQEGPLTLRRNGKRPVPRVEQLLERNPGWQVLLACQNGNPAHPGMAPAPSSPALGPFLWAKKNPPVRAGR